MRGLVIGMERVAVARQRADGQPCVAQLLEERARASFVREERIDIEVIVAGPAARAQLQRLDSSQGADFGQHLLLIQPTQHRSEQTEFHRDSRLAPSDFSVSARTAVQTPPRRWLASTASTMVAAI